VDDTDRMDDVALAVRSARVTDAERASGLATLSPAERERYAASVPLLRDRFLAGRMLLRALVAEQLGLAPDAVPLVATCPDCGGPHGRPELAGSDLRVSLTHAGGLVIAVATHGRAIGIDAEPLAEPLRADATARDAAIRSVAAGEGLLHWTRVEAALKADGRGLRVKPSDVHIDDTTATASIPGSPKRYELFEPDIDPSLQVSVALELQP
jgi:4'-phosphopantetheinyl transferase